MNNLGINARVDDLGIRIAKDINASKLPLCMVESVLSRLHAEIRERLVQQTIAERNAYEAAQAEAEEDDAAEDAPPPKPIKSVTGKAAAGRKKG